MKVIARSGATKQSRSRLLRRSAPRNDRVIGIGNADRGDDAVGRVVTRLLQRHTDVRVIEHDGETTALLAAFQDADRVWLIDAAQSGAPPGTVHRIDCSTGMAIPRGSISSHGFGVAEAIELARALSLLPPHCIVYAIEAAAFTVGAPMSPAVTQAAHHVAERILAELTPPPLSDRRPRRPELAKDRR